MPGSSQILNIVLAPSFGSTHPFTNIEKILLAAYFCNYTRPGPEDYIEVAPVRWAVSHYIARLYFHVCTWSLTPLLAPMQLEIHWNTINQRSYFLPDLDTLLQRVGPSDATPSPKHNTQLVSLLLESIRLTMASHSSRQVCDTFRGNRCLEVLHYMCEYLGGPQQLAAPERNAMSSIALDYVRAVTSHSDAVWQEGHLDYVFGNLSSILDRGVSFDFTDDICMLVESKPYDSRWDKALTRMEEEDGEEELDGSDNGVASPVCGVLGGDPSWRKPDEIGPSMRNLTQPSKGCPILIESTPPPSSHASGRYSDELEWKFILRM
ncbi:hypothetical protein BDV98DRAFT_606015 [Pterulicium gracile]|uniref:Uncharacterized protein n=1 Tax=Pterulicium gracile TaxID=1884261 RepID=A0A5C3QD60_9AGAR|nr:hypothetical protein BDV98DRAFT_606015 [Pterula gracilis]